MFCVCWDWGRAALEGVDGGRIGAGCRLFVGAIGTSLKVWKADGIGICAAAIERRVSRLLTYYVLLAVLEMVTRL